MRSLKFRVWDKQMYSWEDTKKWDIGQFERLLYQSVKDVVLMQFTGLLDKSGKEIYEGDIINTNYQTDIVIPYYVKEALPFITMVNAKNEEYNNGDYYVGEDVQQHSWDEFEIIGNIYENKDRL